MMDPLPVLRCSPTTCVTCCQQCKQMVTLPIAPLRAGDHPLSVTCLCGHEMRLTRERRRSKRKTVQLSGVLLDQTTHEALMHVTIHDLALGNAGFVAHSRAIEVDDRFTLYFLLDDECHTMIQEDIVVRSVTEQRIGAEFVAGGAYNADLDYYLNPYVVLL